jgi:hypothetical protein
MAEQIKGFKGFDNDFKCRGFQFEVGKSYKHQGEVKICNSGFHFCANPLDILGYYPPTDSRFGKVAGSGDHEEHNEDSKITSRNIHIEAEITLSALLGAGVKFILDKIDWTNKKESNTGDQSAATNTGVRSAATNTGDHSAATNTGVRSAATFEGKDSIACGLGYACKARGTLGCWIVLAERNDDGSIRAVKTALVDGKKIKEMQFYELRNGKFCKAE